MKTKTKQPASTRDVIPGFGTRLKAAREAAGLSQQELADKAGTHFTTISKLERGDRAVSLRLAGDIADALGVTTEALRGR